MWTRRIDRALEAMMSCRRRLPDLAELYAAGSPEREALIRAVAAVEDAQRVIFGRHARPPTPPTPGV
jgi:hypothetical protein